MARFSTFVFFLNIAQISSGGVFRSPFSYEIKNNVDKESSYFKPITILENKMDSGDFSKTH